MRRKYKAREREAEEAEEEAKAELLDYLESLERVLDQQGRDLRSLAHTLNIYRRIQAELEGEEEIKGAQKGPS